MASMVNCTQEQLVSIDGKIIGGYKLQAPKSAIYMVSAWASDNKTVLD